MARRRPETTGLDLECAGRLDHQQHGDRAQHQRKGRCLCVWDHPTDSRHFQLLRAIAAVLRGPFMRGKRLSIGLRAALAIFAAALLMTSTWAAAQENILHNFNGTDGAGPQAGLVMDAAGNLYGTTYNGGTYNYGTVFELTPAAGGGWTERVLYMFGNDPSGVSGINPEATLIYSLVQPEPAHQLGRRKVERIIATPAQAVATGNPGCQLEIVGLLNEAGQPLPVMHYMELLDASISGAELPLSRGGER